MTYQQLPAGWDTYWKFRVTDKMVLSHALRMMKILGWKEFEEQTYFTLLCECQQCLEGHTEHKNEPRVILPVRHYNEPERERGHRYGHPY
jgi:hypothetical protein